MDHDPLHREFVKFLQIFVWYLSHRLRKSGLHFERYKNFIVDILMVRRGANTSVFMHLFVLGLAVSVFIAGGFLTSTTVISGSYPGVAANPLVAGASDVSADFGLISTDITPVTVISDKPRDKVIKYLVKSGDTISTISKEYGVSEETIYWENDMNADSQLTEGETIRILPLSGIAHQVESGDTIYSVAKTYQASAQAIIDFPFNDIGDNFSLTTGQLLIVPDGAPPQKPKPAPTQYLASSKQNVSVSDLGSARFIWPASGDIQQYFAWYHPGVDISNLGGGPIRASDSGTVITAGWPDASGYGNRVILDHGNGYKTLYAHMSAIYVSVGQRIGKGEVLGAMGSTGRSTGVHLHFEVINEGTHVNPLSVLGK